MRLLAALVAAGLVAAGCGGEQVPADGGKFPDAAVEAPGDAAAGLDAATVAPAFDAARPDAGADAPDAGGEDTGAPLFANPGFEDYGSDLRPKSWTCSYFGQGTPPKYPCAVRPGGVRGKHLEIAPEVAVYQETSQVTPGRHLRFEVFAQSEDVVSAAAFYLYGHQGTADLFTLFGRVVVPAPEAPGWSRVSSFTAPEDGCTGLRMIVFNASPTALLLVDELTVTEGDQPMVPSGHLLRAEHGGAFSCSAGAEEAIAWVPLPLAHGVQVPLHVALEVDPPSAVTRVEYTLDPEGNFGARLHVAPEASFDEIAVRWTGVVLTREVAESSLPALHPAVRSPGDWLAATAIVQTQDPDLRAAVDQALAGTSGSTDPVGAMSKVLAWTSAYVTNPSELKALDALSVFRSRNGSCTGYANLAAAAGRLAGVPTRSVANYLVGMAQQTHSINEFWLGPGRGWRLVEPQATATRLPADYAVVVRLILPEDEGAGALDSSQNWAIPGVPLNSLLTPQAGAARCQPSWASAPRFPECPECDNKATYQAGLLADPAVMATLFDRAGELWKQTLVRLTTTGPDAGEAALRARALEARDVAAVSALLDELEARR